VVLTNRAPTGIVRGYGGQELKSSILPIMGMAMEGHVRVGLEDNLYYSKGVLAKSNAELVERVVKIAREYGREIASPKEAKKILNLA
jgi:3-keto-5-aminohexanoate cleavage enzyme